MPDPITELEDDAYNEGYADGMRAAVPVVLEALGHNPEIPTTVRGHIDRAIELAIIAFEQE